MATSDGRLGATRIRVVLAVLAESPTAPRMFMESFRSFLYVIPVNQVRDRHLSSNCHKRVNLLQIIVRADLRKSTTMTCWGDVRVLSSRFASASAQRKWVASDRP